MLPRSCVCVLTVGLPDPSRQTARPDAGDGWSGGIVLAEGQNRPERNPAERPGRDVLARRANRDAGRNAAVRPHGRMRDGPKGRSPLRHAKPSWGGRKALARVDVLATPLPTIRITCPSIRCNGRVAEVRCNWLQWPQSAAMIKSRRTELTSRVASPFGAPSTMLTSSARTLLYIIAL